MCGKDDAQTCVAKKSHTDVDTFLLSESLSNAIFVSKLLSEKMNLSVVILKAKMLADGTHKLRIAIAHNGTTRYMPTRFVIPSADCLKKGVVTNKVDNASYINQQLRSLMTRIYTAFDQIEDADCYTCSQLVQLLYDKLNSKKPKTYREISEEWLSTKISSCKESTYELYRVNALAFEEFAGKDYVLSLMTSKTIWDYDAFLMSKNNDTTINIKMTVLRGIVNLAIARKYVSYEVHPFNDYKSRSVNVRDCCIPVSVLRKLRDYKSEDASKQRAVDIFMLSFYMAGMNIADLIQIDLSNDNVSFMREKTIKRRRDNIKTEFTIQPEARAIISKYITKSGKIDLTLSAGKSKNRSVSKVCVTANVNLLLKGIAKEIGYDKNIVFYSARKTFAQLGFLHNIQERVITYCIGDSIRKQNDMMSFYVNTNKQLADDCIRKVLDFVAGEKNEDSLIGEGINGIK